MIRPSRPALASLAVAACTLLACNTISNLLPRAAPAASTPAPPAAGPELETFSLAIPGGPVIGSPAETAAALAEASTPRLEQLAQEVYSSADYEQVGRVFNYSVELSTDEPLMWGYGWCAADADTLRNNLADMRIVFRAQGYEVDVGQMAVLEGTSGGGMACREYWALVSRWPAGVTTLEVEVTYLATVNDGFSDYPPGTQTFVYTVSVP